MRHTLDQSTRHVGGAFEASAPRPGGYHRPVVWPRCRAVPAHAALNSDCSRDAIRKTSSRPPSGTAPAPWVDADASDCSPTGHVNHGVPSWNITRYTNGPWGSTTWCSIRSRRAARLRVPALVLTLSPSPRKAPHPAAAASDPGSPRPRLAPSDREDSLERWPPCAATFRGSRADLPVRGSQPPIGRGVVHVPSRCPPESFLEGT